MESEQRLAGGNMNAVVRVGDTVRRLASPQTASVHRLLGHVRDSGVMWVPRPHGIDDEGREVLDYLPGEAVHDLPTWLWDREVLTTVAARLREWHDATATFPRHADDVWWQEEIEPVEVICHVDFAPYNHVYREGRFVGAIDFDLCTPGPRIWDLAYTAYRYVPLTPQVGEDVPDGDTWGRSEFTVTEQRERLAAFADAYGDVSAAEILACVPRRLDAMADWCALQNSEALRADGIMYRSHARWLESGPLAAAG